MAQLLQLGLYWDGEPLLQSQRLQAYEAALETDVTLRDRLSSTSPTAEEIHAVLRERLNAAL